MSDHRKTEDGPGLVEIYTGTGKGKTTMAFGLALRAVGQGMNVKIIQFLKPDQNYGEQTMAKKIQGMSIESYGIDHMDGTKVDETTEGELTAKAMEASKKALESGEYDIVILDEIDNSVRFKLVTPQEIIDMLEGRKPGVEVILTGRGAPQELIDYADLVSEVRKIKHPYDVGVPARKGIEY